MNSLIEEDLKDIAVSSLEDSKASDITVIDLEGKTSFARFMIVATGSVNKHVQAIASRLAAELKERDFYDVHIEGMQEANWVLVDIGHIVVNIFKPDAREFYNIENIWSNQA